MTLSDQRSAVPLFLEAPSIFSEYENLQDQDKSVTKATDENESSQYLSAKHIRRHDFEEAFALGFGNICIGAARALAHRFASNN
jgi:hypothetical protein